MAKRKADTSNWSDAMESGRVVEETQPTLLLYPRVLYRHDRVDRITVENEEAEAALGPGWHPAPPEA